MKKVIFSRYTKEFEITVGTKIFVGRYSSRLWNNCKNQLQLQSQI
jgi:hypothetical protein